jgi:hypothetical protein
MLRSSIETSSCARRNLQFESWDRVRLRQPSPSLRSPLNLNMETTSRLKVLMWAVSSNL